MPDDFHALPVRSASTDDGAEMLNLADIRNALKSLMWRSVGVRRDREHLRDAADDVDHWCSYVLARQFDDPEGWELQNMLTISRLMIEAALAREETRGVHLRVDYPETDNVRWKRRITFRRDS
jgi:L-aspartate oxidase